jgi:thiol-disulfide isomerase/thioredoxin/uncharacterized membrane protein YphA (DoxX/SURF4 family)
VVHGYAVVPDLLVHPVALGLILLEVTLGTLLLLGLSVRFAAGGIVFLAVVFLVTLVQAKVRGLDISCGCFGGDGTGQGVSWFDLIRTPLILAAAVYLLVRGSLDRFALDRLVPRARGSQEELTVGVPLILVAAIIAASLVIPGLTGALDLPQAASPEQVSVAGQARSAPLPAGSTVPDFSAPALYGGEVSWQAYRGTPTILVVWAAWCPECREQLPLLARVQSDFPGVRLVSVVTAAGGLPGPTPEQFMRSHDLPFPVALDSTDERLSDALGVQGYPTVYYVRSDNTVSEVTVGATPEAAVRAAMGAIAR